MQTVYLFRIWRIINLLLNQLCYYFNEIKHKTFRPHKRKGATKAYLIMASNISTQSANIYFDPTAKIGRCLSGNVYRGKFQNKEVAVKVIIAVTWRHKTELVEEIKISQLTRQSPHKNVLQSFHIQRGEKYTQIIFEICQANVAEWVKTNGQCISPAVIHPKQICLQIAAGVNHFLSLNVVHVDLKPRNVLLSVSPDHVMAAKVAGFGFCEIIPERSRYVMSKSHTKSTRSTIAHIISCLEDDSEPDDRKPSEILNMVIF